MNKKEAIAFLNNEGWTKADAKRALELLDFKANLDVDEITVLRIASQFAGSELLHRQYLQGAQKAQVTNKKKEIQKYIAQIKKLETGGSGHNLGEIIELRNEISKLIGDKNKLEEVNDLLKKDNKEMASIVSEIKFKLAVQIKEVINFKDPRQIKTKLVKLINNVSG